MTAKSVLLRPQGLRPGARAPLLLRHCSDNQLKSIKIMQKRLEKYSVRYIPYKIKTINLNFNSQGIHNID